MSLLLVALLVTMGVEAQQSKPPGERIQPARSLPALPLSMVSPRNSWRMVPLVSLLRKTILAIHFSDRMNGWAGGEEGLLVRTDDGGMTWQRVERAPHEDIVFIHFADRDHGWMVGKSRAAAQGGASVLLRTNNGGRTWKRQSQSDLARLHFRNLREGWAAGRGALLLKTEDGGASWRQVSELERLIGYKIDSIPHNYGFSDVFFLDQNHGWAVGNFYGRKRDHVGGLFLTRDGGASWERMSLPLSALARGSRFLPGRLRAVRFADRQQGILLGEIEENEQQSLFVLLTRDGGRSWQVLRRERQAPLSIHFYQTAKGWWVSALERSGAPEGELLELALVRAEIGGVSWQTEFQLRGERLRALYFPSPAGGWAVGERGLIVRCEAVE